MVSFTDLGDFFGKLIQKGRLESYSLTGGRWAASYRPIRQHKECVCTGPGRDQQIHKILWD